MIEQELDDARRIYAKYNLDLDKLRNLEAAALHQIRRLAGLDPDGPHAPMQPYLTDAQKWTEIRDEQNKHLSDAYLITSLRFT